MGDWKGDLDWVTNIITLFIFGSFLVTRACTALNHSSELTRSEHSLSKDIEMQGENIQARFHPGNSFWDIGKGKARRFLCADEYERKYRRYWDCTTLE
jgi:hypothetical protein